jgi:hypothetical protein
MSFFLTWIFPAPSESRFSRWMQRIAAFWQFAPSLGADCLGIARLRAHDAR